MINKRLNELIELNITNGGLLRDEAVEVLLAYTHLKARWDNVLDRFQSIGTHVSDDDENDLMHFRILRDDCLGNK